MKFSCRALFHIKTRVCLKYSVNDCRSKDFKVKDSRPTISHQKCETNSFPLILTLLFIFLYQHGSTAHQMREIRPLFKTYYFNFKGIFCWFWAILNKLYEWLRQKVTWISHQRKTYLFHLLWKWKRILVTKCFSMTCFQITRT